MEKFRHVWNVPLGSSTRYLANLNTFKVYVLAEANKIYTIAIVQKVVTLPSFQLRARLLHPRNRSNYIMNEGRHELVYYHKAFKSLRGEGGGVNY